MVNTNARPDECHRIVGTQHGGDFVVERNAATLHVGNAHFIRETPKFRPPVPLFLLAPSPQSVAKAVGKIAQISSRPGRIGAIGCAITQRRAFFAHFPSTWLLAGLQFQAPRFVDYQHHVLVGQHCHPSTRAVHRQVPPPVLCIDDCSGLVSLSSAHYVLSTGPPLSGGSRNKRPLVGNTGGVLPRARALRTTRRQPGSRGRAMRDNTLAARQRQIVITQAASNNLKDWRLAA